MRLSSRYIHTSHKVDPSQWEPGIAPDQQAYDHVLDFLFFDLELSGTYFLNRWLGLKLYVPIRMVGAQAQFHNFEGQEIAGFKSIHHRQETIMGIADIGTDAVFRVRPFQSKTLAWIMHVETGFRWPTGTVEPNPDQLGLEGKEHQHLFFGRGSIVPILGMSHALRLPDFTIDLWGRLIYPFYAHELGYRASRTASGGLGLSSKFGLSQWQFGVFGDLSREMPAQWGDAPARNSGRTQLNLNLRFQYYSGPKWAHGLTLQIPVYRKVPGGQMRAVWMLSLESNWFGLEEGIIEPDDTPHTTH